jgi:adenosine deaminase CECR1
LKAEWLSSLKLDRPGEGRNEFFDIIGPRIGEMRRDPYLFMDLLVETMRRYGAEGLRYLETQAGPSGFRDQEGNLIDVERGVQFFRDRLSRPDAIATGVTVRFQLAVDRSAPSAEEQLEGAYAFVDRHRELWTGINIVGREDDRRGYALRFLDTFRRMRRTYSGIHLSLHGGEVDSPGHEVRDTLLLGAERIGHGVNLIGDPDTMLLMRTGHYLVEVSLISNHLLEYTPDLAKHPFPEYLRFGIPVCLNTDDPGAWDSNLTDEYFTAVTTYNLTWDEIVQIGRNSLQYSFVEPAVKERLLAEYERAVQNFERKYKVEDWRSILARVRPEVSGYAARNLR